MELLCPGRYAEPFGEDGWALAVEAAHLEGN